MAISGFPARLSKGTSTLISGVFPLFDNNIIISLLTDYVGISDLSGITSFLDEVDLGQGSVGIQILGGILLMFSCTAILNALKKSINTFYGITPSRKKQKRKIISNHI